VTLKPSQECDPLLPGESLEWSFSLVTFRFRLLVHALAEGETPVADRGGSPRAMLLAAYEASRVADYDALNAAALAARWNAVPR